MKNHTQLIFYCLFFTLSLNAQRNISGVVKGEDNQERLPFADIIIKGTNTGTSTNVDGYFSLIDLPDTAMTLQVLYTRGS